MLKDAGGDLPASLRQEGAESFLMKMNPREDI